MAAKTLTGEDFGGKKFKTTIPTEASWDLFKDLQTQWCFCKI